MIKQRRKSNRHELMINCTNDENISPLRRQKSYSKIPSTPTIDQINTTNNDDATERENLHSRTNSLVSSVFSSWKRSINFGAISKMSTSQISNCITECIKFSVDKNINIKNSFNLKIIDYMTCYVARN